MLFKNEKAEKIKRILIDKIYYNNYKGGYFLEFDDNPYLQLPELELFYDIDDIKPLIPEKFNNVITLEHINTIMEHGITIIKPSKNNVNNIQEFSELQTEFLNTLLELANELPENPVWNKCTYPVDKSGKICCPTIN